MLATKLYGTSGNFITEFSYVGHFNYQRIFNDVNLWSPVEMDNETLSAKSTLLANKLIFFEF